MSTELFTVCALPHSCATGSKFHVSLFISPRLVPDKEEDELGQFTLFPRWGALMAEKAGQPEIELFDQLGPIDAEPLLDPLDAEAWDAAFPSDTPVRGQGVPEWSGRRWRSFDAKTVHDLGKGVHMGTIYSDPTSPPSPLDHPLSGPVRELTAPYYRPDPNVPERAGYERVDHRRMIYDESMATADLDEIVESGESLAVIERVIAGEENWLRRMALELHRARRFYERPESQGKYQETPTTGKASPQLPRPGPEFHERCATAGDHPALLRALGLVIDLRVAEPDRLRVSTWLSARIAPRGDASACRTTRTQCRAVGDDLVSVAETDEWSDGLARLGDEELFAVLDLEADGTALKLDRFLWTLPRLLAIQADEAPVNAATPALRASGFTVSRVGQARDVQGRLERQHELDDIVGKGEPPLLVTEDVTRGLRVEVWDDQAGRWGSLHSRLTDVDIVGHGMVLDDLEEEGFIQGPAAHETPGVADSPIHIHEAVFGWEGWSLSAPRPGKRVRHENGREIPEDPPVTDPDPVHPILITNRVKPGTLPTLRFGRSYALRAWAVDLAGNVRPHDLNPTPAPAPDVSAALASALGSTSGIADVASRLPAELRAATHSVLESRRLTAVDSATQQLAQSVRGAEAVLDPGVLDQVVLPLLRRRRLGRSPVTSPATGSTDRRSLVAEAVAGAVADPDQPFIADTAQRTASALSRLVASHAALQPIAGWADAITRALDTVTPLRPFLRWDPVPNPAVVARRRFTEGESLRVLVVRSGVTQDLDTLAITVTPPEAYASEVTAAHPALHLGYFASSDRHLAPPKTSQVQAELHGTFDDAIGSTDPADHQRLLGVALRENGSFLDLDVADIADPPQRTPQPGVRLEHGPGTPQADLVTLPLLGPDDPPKAGKGQHPAPGQYVVHDTDDLVVPYLPDPLAAGVSFVFEEAGLDRAIPFPFGTEGFTARFLGDWPEVKPFRLVLEGAAQLAGRVDGRVITMSLPAGDTQRFRLASSLDRSKLDWFGPWRSLPPAVHDDPDVAEAAADGWLWGLTPFEDVSLVHAVPRPLVAPRPTKLLPQRAEGFTQVILAGVVELHGPSTDRLTAHATWTDPIDDITLPLWEDRPTSALAFTSPVKPFEELALLWATETDFSLPEIGPVRIHAARHELGDTKHRVITYRFRASTRFREYFRPELLAAPPPPTGIDPTAPVDDGQSVVGPSASVSVPSSARPAAPIVHSVIPLFRWSDGTEPEQPVARRHGRRTGVRIYLERPWFTSGAGELLGVLLAPRGGDNFGPPPPDQSGFPFVSKWGGDPAWASAPIERRPLELVQLDNLLHSSGDDDRLQPGRPVTPAVALPLASLPDRPEVSVVGYRPQYNAARRLWYVDVAFDPGATFWPFVRLAVCRYQPDSIPGCHLSAPYRCDFVQLPPERTTSVSRTDDRHVRVVVSGPVGVREVERRERVVRSSDAFAQAVDANRVVVASLQRRDPTIPSDLGWQTIATEKLTVRGRGKNQYEAAWVGELDAGQVIALKRPGDDKDWRVAIEEWEALPGDPRSPLDGPVGIVASPVWERRLIYADEIPL